MSNLTKEKLQFTEDVENLLLSGCLYDRKLWVDFSQDIDPSYFNDPCNSTIFKILKVYFDKYGSFPTPTVIKDVISRKNYDNKEDLITHAEQIYAHDTFKETDIEYIHHETGKFIKENKIKDAVLNSVGLLEEGKFPEIEEEIRQAVNWNTEVNFGIRIDQVEDRFKRLESLVSGVIPSPWMSLNQHLGGGFFNKELTIFVGSSSVGKSIALDNCALYAWQQGYNVVMITLELSEVRKAQRIDAAATRINASEIIANKEQVIRYYQSNERENKLFIKEYPYASINARDIRQYLYQLELYGYCKKPDLLIVDYLDIMNPVNVTRNTYEDQGTTGGNLRALGQEGDFPVVTASQFSKNNLTVSIEDLSEFYIADSFKKVMVADTLIGMASTPEQRAEGKMNYKLMKSRNGKKDEIILLNVDYPKLLITDIFKKQRG